MTNLKKYKLDAEKTLEYINQNLEGMNVLSKLVVNSSPFNEGQFFTFLRKGISLGNVIDKNYDKLIHLYFI
jgi:hypothetical protein